MKEIYKGVCILMIIFSFSEIQAQVETLNFTLDSDIVKISGYDTEIASTLKKTENNIIWTQYANGSTNATQFTINNTTGNWNQEVSKGSITFLMTIEGYQSKLTLSGQESGISATLTLTISDTQEKNYIFNINAITYQ